MKVEKGKFYTCLRGNYTRNTIVKVVDIGTEESQVMIVSMLPSEGRNKSACNGQVWSVNNEWLVLMRDMSNPNLLFSFRKMEKKS